MTSSVALIVVVVAALAGAVGLGIGIVITLARGRQTLRAATAQVETLQRLLIIARAAVTRSEAHADAADALTFLNHARDRIGDGALDDSDVDDLEAVLARIKRAKS